MANVEGMEGGLRHRTEGIYLLWGYKERREVEELQCPAPDIDLREGISFLPSSNYVAFLIRSFIDNLLGGQRLSRESTSSNLSATQANRALNELARDRLPWFHTRRFSREENILVRSVHSQEIVIASCGMNVTPSLVAINMPKKLVLGTKLSEHFRIAQPLEALLFAGVALHVGTGSLGPPGHI
ncbi:hypothetical protein OF83DRAFT_1083199 [Amylostereum chailletii]|nr:hypothetical protein OF83DRAFT_1083199 [Amylostereum chailletii]